MAERKAFLLRLDPRVHDALQRWAADDLRSLNAQIEFLLRRAIAERGRLRKDDDGGLRPEAGLPPEGRRDG